MTTRKHWLKSLMRTGRAMCASLLSIVCVAALSSCGTVDESSFRAYDVSHISRVDEIARLVPESVARDGKLSVGMNASYAPAEFLASDGQTPVGYDVDLSRAMAQVLGLKAQFVNASFDSIIPSIGSKFDIGMSAFSITPERIETVDFVSYFKAGEKFVVRKGNPKHVNRDQLCGRKIGVQTGTIEEQHLLTASEQCDAQDKPDIEVMSFKQQATVTTAVMTGKIDAFYADSPVAGYAMSQTGDALESLGQDIGVAHHGIAITKGDEQTVEAIQQAMQWLMDSGDYQKILHMWGADDGAEHQALINPQE